MSIRPRIDRQLRGSMRSTHAEALEGRGCARTRSALPLFKRQFPHPSGKRKGRLLRPLPAGRGESFDLDIARCAKLLFGRSKPRPYGAFSNSNKHPAGFGIPCCLTVNRAQGVPFCELLSNALAVHL